MTNDLVKRLRQLGDRTGLMYVDYDTTIEAADRIEQLEAALHEWDALIRHQYTGSREAMSDMQYAAQITAALLHGEAPWPETRIEKLEAALRSIAANACCDSCREAALVARKALEWKDD